MGRDVFFFPKERTVLRSIFVEPTKSQETFPVSPIVWKKTPLLVKTGGHLANGQGEVGGNSVAPPFRCTEGVWERIHSSGSTNEAMMREARRSVLMCVALLL